MVFDDVVDAVKAELNDTSAATNTRIVRGRNL